MTNFHVRDYASSGLTIQYAMNDHATRFPDRATRPKYILWNGRHIWTSDALNVPNKGLVRLDFLSTPGTVRQGVDLKLNGYITLAEGEQVALLRTWQDKRYEDTVEYPYFTGDGILWTWNVYEMSYANGQKVEEKWTENAGFWVESISNCERVYHCSHGMAAPPDFESLVFKLSVTPH